MYEAAGTGFINATDCADYLTSKGVPFRDAYKITGDLVEYCTKNNKTLEVLTLEEYRKYSKQFELDVYDAVDLKNCVFRRRVIGGPAPERVKEHIEKVRRELEKLSKR